MAEETDVRQQVARAPMRTLRLKDIVGAGQRTWRVVDRLVEQGALVRLVHGIYTAPPDGRDGRTWRPPLEDAALAVAVARHGARQAAMTGISAARHWAAIPRAVAVATIAVPRAGYADAELDRGGVVKFVPRELERLALIMEPTVLGRALVTTREQTFVDLLMRPDQGGLRSEAIAAARNLRPQLDAVRLDRVLEVTTRQTTLLKDILAEAREEERNARPG